MERRGDYIALRMLTYLQSCANLTLECIAVDATSCADMASLVDRIVPPLGGCMLLAVAYMDRVFSMHTHDSFESAFPPKVDAFLALEQVLDINSLDFFIAFSSAGALFGNAGQTNYAG